MIGQSRAFDAKDREWWRGSRVEACCAHEDVDVVMCPVCRLDTSGRHARDALADERHVILDQRFEETRAGRQAAASRREGRDQPVGVLWFLGETSPHAGLEDCLCARLHRSALDGEGVDGVAGGFELCPEGLEVSGVGAEAGTLGGGEGRAGHLEVVLDGLAKGG